MVGQVPINAKYSANSVDSSAIVNGAIVNADINASAAVAWSKMAAMTAGYIIVGSAATVPTAVAVSGDITLSNAGVAAIATGVIVNADVNASAAIAYSKLNLTGSILNADISTSAGISHSKLAAGTSGQILIADGSGTFTAASVSGDATLSNAGVFALSSDVTIRTLTAESAQHITLVADAAKDVIVTLGDAAGTSELIVEDSAGVDLFKIASTGIITLENGCTITNSSAADTLTITETKVDIAGDLTPSTLTMDTGTAITADTFASVAGHEMNFAGADGFDIEMKLGDDDGTEDFHIADVANVELFKVDSTGIITLENGATITNSTAVDTLTITETKIDIVGDLTPSTLTMDTGTAITADTFASVAGHEMVISGADGFDVEIKLGDDDGVEDFHIAEVDGDELFNVNSLGLITLKGGTTLDNHTAANTLTVTETNIDFVGAVTCNSITSDAGVTATTAVTGATLVGKKVDTEVAHDYAGAHADWTLSASDMLKDYLIVTNADAGAAIIGPETMYTYTIRNTSTQDITIKKSGGAGVTIANNKTATVRYSTIAGDYVRVTADQAH